MTLVSKMCKAVDNWPDGLDGHYFFWDKEIHGVYGKDFHSTSIENEFLEKYCEMGEPAVVYAVEKGVRLDKSVDILVSKLGNRYWRLLETPEGKEELKKRIKEAF